MPGGIPAIPAVDLRVPDRVQLGVDFNVTVNHDAPYESIEFDLVLDQPGVELARPAKEAEGAQVQTAQAGQIIHVSGGKRTQPGAVVAVITMKAARMPASPVSISVQNLRVKGADGADLPAAVTLPKQFTVHR